MRKLVQIICLAALCLGLSAEELTGIWVGQIPVGRQGAMLDIAFKIDQKGNVIQGKLYGDYKSSPITEGSITGNQVTFSVITQEQAGNEINNTLLKFTGTVNGNELEVTRERGFATSAGNGGGYQFRNNKPVTFKLKRLI